MTQTEFLALARTWIGTPYHDQARLKGVGADCIGFIVGVVSEATGRHVVAPITYGRYPNPAIALQGIRDSGECHDIDVKQARVGDVIYMRIAREPQHFGIISDAGQIIHCTETTGVVEVNFADWMRAKVMYAFRLNFLQEG
jgi:NlpC/P60 family putative phage cell wall peptidase